MASASDYLKALTPVKPGDPVVEAASAARLNAIMDLLKFLAAGGNINTGPNIRKKSQDGWVILTGEPGGTNRGGAIIFPFMAKLHTSENPPIEVDGITIYPGTIETKVPTIYGTALDADTPPVLLGTTFTASLLVIVAINAEDNYRYGVTDVTVEYADPISQKEWEITWDDDTTKASGYFYIHLADVKDKAITRQRLFSSFRNLAFIQKQVIALGIDQAPVPVPPATP